MTAGAVTAGAGPVAAGAGAFLAGVPEPREAAPAEGVGEPGRRVLFGPDLPPARPLRAPPPADAWPTVSYGPFYGGVCVPLPLLDPHRVRVRS
ncbi:hypothetical protein DN402_02225 [Streptomyces sp. SW4]|nr:hypothetical protein DN402_02225 [Streptomyces sp. SW4]